MKFVLIGTIVHKVPKRYKLKEGEIFLPKLFDKYEINVYAHEIIEDNSFYHAFGKEEVYSYEYIFKEAEWDLLEKGTVELEDGFWVELVDTIFADDLDEKHRVFKEDAVEIDGKLYVLHW